MLGAAERSLGVDHPVVAEKSSQPRSKRAWFGQMHEATTKHTFEHMTGQKEAAGRADPTAMIRCQPSGGYHAMYVRVKLQSLIPRVQDAEEADVRAEVTWVAGHL